MTTNNMGGGYNPTKAVLNALGKNYIVEQGSVQSSKDSTKKIYYRRWSSGFIEQWSDEEVSGRKTYTYVIPFSDTNYCLIGGFYISGVASCTFVDRTETGFTHHQSAYSTAFYGWYACGY